MSSSPDAHLRFPLNSYGYFPRWFEYALHGWFAVVGALWLAALVSDRGWLGLFGLAVFPGFLVISSLASRKFRSRKGNYVELGATSFDLAFWGFIHLTVPYAQVASVEGGMKANSFFSRWVWPWRVHSWPYPMFAWGEHTEVRLTAPIRVPILSRLPPWVQVIDLDTERGDDLARELRARVGLDASAP
jgi:hypothetical protein